MQKVIRNNYNWTNKAGWNRIKNLEIELPIKDDGSINFEHINSYMSNCKKTITDKINEKLASLNLASEAPTEEEIINKLDYFSGKKTTKVVPTKSLFKVVYNNSVDKGSLQFSKESEYPYFTRTVFDNGIAGYCDYLDDEHKIKGNSIAIGLLQMRFFYMEHDFYAGQFTKTIFPLFEGFNENIGLFFASLFNKQSELYKSVLVRDFDNIFLESHLEIPVNTKGELDLEFIDKFVSCLKKESLSNISLI